MSDAPLVLLSRSAGVGTITLNRPDKLNAVDDVMRKVMVSAVKDMVADKTVRVIVLTGAGRAFCAGGDIEHMRQLSAAGDMKAGTALVETGRALVMAIRKSGKPVIASVNGAAAGGGANLALACDIRIASDRATIGQTFNRIGLVPDWGGSYFLPRLVGPAKALELVYNADMIAAAEALRIGLFNRVVPHDDLPRETASYAQMLAAKPPKALALAKRAIYRSGDATLPDMLSLELKDQLACFQSADAKEGLSAFLEKRPAVFRGS
ncbi:MAG TPA: enoyl-CoA hydratase-related protein [Gemmatimonadales bacterium]